MRRGFEILPALLLVLLVAFWQAASSAAAQTSKRVVVQSFRGPSGAVARTHVMAALKREPDVEIYPAESFEGISGEALTAAAAEAGVSAIIEGKVRKKGKLLQVNVSVRDASSGEVVHEQDWTRRKNQLDDLRDRFWPAMRPHVMRTSVPEAPEKPAQVAPVEKPRTPPEPENEPARVAPEPVSRPAPEPELEHEAERPKAVGSRFHPALVVAFGPRLMWRKLAYEGGTTLNAYSSYARDEGDPSFNLALQVQWFPGAHTRSDWLSDIGFEADGDIALGLSSRQGPSGKEYKTNAYEIAGGLVYRLPFEMFEPRVRAHYVLHDFNPKTPISLATPAVKYSAIRFGAGTLIKLVEAFALDVSFAYLLVLDTGEFGTPKFAADLSAWAWEVGAGALVRIKQVYGLRLAADFRRYMLDTGKSENSMFVLPKKATDDYLRATLSFVYMLPGA